MAPPRVFERRPLDSIKEVIDHLTNSIPSGSFTDLWTDSGPVQTSLYLVLVEQLDCE